MGKRKKTLLAEQGILHLKNCFVQPSEESGLLHTVGGQQEQPLVLASGNYGYGIPSSIAKKQAENEAQQRTEVDPDVQLVRELNGGVFSAAEMQRERTGDMDSEMINHEEMTVAQLVRSIGGAKDAPLRKCDVVEDGHGHNDKEGTEGDELMEQDPEADEFYASIGMQNPNEKTTKDNDEKEDEEQGKDPEKNQEPGEVTEGIRDFYKKYTQYYYSKDIDPYSEERLQFGVPIAPEESSDQIENSGEQTIIQLAKMAQLRARQAKAAAEALEKAKKAKTIGSSTVGPGEVVEDEADIYDPLPMEVVPSKTAEELGITQDTTLDQYWDFVKDDPHDFNRWIYLIHYAESKNHVGTMRKVYSAFLPLFSYCFGYWKRYSDMEKRFNYFGRALTILERGLEFIPLSVDLWVCYIKLYGEVHAHEDNIKDLLRDQYERSLNTSGMDFRSDVLWENFIKFEMENKKLKRAFHIFARVLQVPTRLFNRHWDNFRALVRDHHPRDFLEKDQYEHLRKKGCKKLGFKYKEEPEYEAGEIVKPSKPEDKLMDYVKEKILKKMTKIHEKNEQEVDKRWMFEDRIRRPYFHTKPLDKYQLRNWEEYLNFEISEGNHDRIVLLFERCLIACALYENFWCKYARYLEDYHKKNPNSNEELSVHFLKSQENVEIGTKQETEEEEKRIEDAKVTIEEMICLIEREEEKEIAQIDAAVKHLVNAVALQELRENNETVVNMLNPVINEVIGDNGKGDLSGLSDEFFELAGSFKEKVDSVGYLAAAEELRGEILVSPKLIGDRGTSVSKPPVKSGEQEIYLSSPAGPFTTLLSVPDFPHAKYAWQEAVRDVYKRGTIVHCPKKPAIRLQWAAFEEELGNSEHALELMTHIETWFPTYLEAKMFTVELQRRRKRFDEVSKLYEKYLTGAGKNRQEYTMISLKYARFLHKEMRKPDKALKILRNAIKKDRTNPRLYSYVFDICYEKYPDDKKAALASLELAISSKELTDEQRLVFLKKKLLFLQEHGDIRRYRETLQHMTELQEIVRKKETEEMRRKEEEMRLRIGAMNPNLLRFPVPDFASSKETPPDQQPVPIEYEVVNGGSPHPVNFAPDKQAEGQEPAFKKVAPPEGLNLSDYGYASKHPDYKLQEYMAHREYEKLESQGYPEDIKDKEEDRATRKRKAEEEKEKNAPIYIVHPKSSTMYVSSSSAPVAAAPSTDPAVLGAKGPEVIELEAPQKLSEVAVPSTSPCINVPEWFVKEGGELCLSETKAGFSVLRYWPHFLNDLGQQKMFKSVRRSVKWHQKQRVVWGQWRYVPRLVSWLGPCDWSDRGLELKKNEDWPPEILDLLHRINQITQHEFNSCFLNLYRTGHDSHPWHGDVHPAYGANPPVATISLGSMRLFEMKRRGPVHNFIRFPLVPGSLVIMEGACQVDWSHQVPKDPKVDGERISLVFRIMHAIEPLDKDRGRDSSPKDKVKAMDKNREEEENEEEEEEGEAKSKDKDAETKRGDKGRERGKDGEEKSKEREKEKRRTKDNQKDPLDPLEY